MRPLVILFLLALPLAGRHAVQGKPEPSASGKPFITELQAKAMDGDPRAQFDLGVCYRFGQGVPRSEAMAVKWYRKAAAQGYAKAQYNLGVSCDFGQGTPKDHAAAVAWYRKAAEQGHAKAQYNLGVSYKYGQGVALDRTEAYAWLTLAAANGAKIALRSREDVARRLSPQELEWAQVRARQLRGELRGKRAKP